MRKFSVVIATVLVFSLMLVACGKNNGGNTNPPATSPTVKPTENNTAPPEDDIKQRKVAISVYYPTPDRVEDRALEDDKIRRFNEVYPNVEVIKSDWQYNPNEIGMKMGANEAPTLFNTYASEGKMLAEKGWAADITELFNNYEFKDQMNPQLQDLFTLNGKVYGIAQRGYPTGVTVNKKMLEDNGVTIPSLDWTWDDMLNAAKGVANPAAGISGIAPMGKENASGWNWTNFLFTAGGDIQSVTDGKVTAIFNSEAGVKALDYYERLKWEANAIPEDWALNWGDAVGAFAEGRTAMVIAGPDGPVDQALNQGGMSPDDIIVYPIPAYQKGDKHYGVLGGDFLVINPNATPDEQEIAFYYATFDYFSDTGLASLEENIKERAADNKYYVPAVLQYYKSDAPYGEKVTALFNKYDNVYQYSVESLGLMDGKAESPYNTQDFYAEMTNIIQEVFSKKGVDKQAKLDVAAKFIQEQFYDSIQ
ncbi:MAG: ABC transporter substrate-binding protein [Candidatus Pristimantibacillus lignocellulolyticus]|uniref:ABC transporter substrate-binding protein n=1 Tax=Candidatus Pristimantibacillus lignocellulolyticus TaxID=2994561 RepID=A0A9J6ZFN2_9BACL|nr:MAG: ABC transporter substrate-binding protein [Candidatus Pristimantibacillus lignocellulolyticus]